MIDNGFILENISFSYGGHPALDNITGQLSPGKFYGIVGPNGCGKTTLLDLLCGYKTAHSGTVLLGGHDLSHYHKKKLAQQVALVPQEFNINHGFSVEEIVMMGRHPHIPRFASPSTADWQLVDGALQMIGLNHLRFRNGSELSGGQKQRAVVARALAQQTQTLLFDEATASLDIKYTIQIFNIAKRRVKEHGHTVVAVLHNMNLAAAYCDELIFMKNGKIHIQGPTAEVMTAENIDKLFGVDARVGNDLFNQAHQISLNYSARDKCQ